MKFALSIAVLALINNSSAIRIRGDDLFNDDEDTATTLASIKSAEQVHGTTFNGINAEDQKNLIAQKTDMKFDSSEEFIKNEKRVYNKVLLQTDSDIRIAEPRPIFEVLAQIERSAIEDGKVLSGTSLNDEDDMESTLDSLKLAEAAYHTKLNAPQVST